MKCGFPKLLSFFALGVFILSSCKDEEKKVSYDLPVNDRGIEELSAKIANAPTNAMLFFQRGTLLHRIQEDSLALEDLKKAVSLDSTKAQYYSAIGDILFEHKDISGSVGWLQKAIKLNPKDPTAQLKVAKMFIFLEEYNKAFDAINTVLRQDVYNPEGYFLKGMAYKGIKDTAKALSSFQTAINAQPQYREAVLQIASIYSAKGDPVAIKYYENAFRIDSNDVSPIYNIGLYYLNKNDIEAAKAQYKRAIMKDQGYANAFFGMGFALMQQDSLEKAWRQFDIVVGLAPTNTDGYYNRGLCSEMMGKTKEAIADYEQTLVFDADYSSATEALKRLKGK